jgi:hypothetical protein
LPRRTKAKLAVTEKSLEDAFGQHITGQGCKYWKQSGLGRNSRPDRHLILPNGISGHIEWKRPGEVPTTLQADELDELEALGHRVACCDSGDSALKFFHGLIGALKEDRSWIRKSWRIRWWEEQKTHPWRTKSLPQKASHRSD